MKSYLLAIVVLAAMFAGTMSPTATAQYPKNVLIEQFTSATCVPCVPAAPIMERAFNVGAGTFVIKYHLNFPAPNDPLYLNAAGDHARRSAIYGVQGIPTARVMGPNTVDPRTETAVTSTVTSQRQGGSPVSLKVIEENGRAKVRIISNIALTNHRLFVAIVGRSITIPNLPQTLPGSNGQTNFKDALLGQAAGPDGFPLDLPANQLGEFDFPIALGSGTVWQGQEQYLVAWVQAIAGNQFSSVLQVNATRDPADSTKLAFIKRSSVVATIQGTVYNKVARGGTHTQTVSVRNNGSAPVTVQVDLSNAAAIRQAGWSYTAPAAVTVAAGATETVSLAATAPLGFSNFQGFSIAVSASDGASPGLDPYYALVEGARVVIYTGTSEADNPIRSFVQSVSLLGPLVADMVILPYNQQANAAYPVSDFEGAIYMIDLWQSGTALGRFANAGILTQVKSLLAAGKKVWVMAEGELYANFSPQSQVVNQEAVSFFSTTLGINYVGLVGLLSGNTLVQATMSGVTNDPIGGGTPTLRFHTRYNNDWNTAQLRLDVFTLTAASPCTSAVTMSVTTQQGQAPITTTTMARYQSPQGGRLVYSTFTLSGLSEDAERNQLTKRVMDWLFPVVVTGPQIELTASSINFNELLVGQTRERDVTVRNTGTQPLEISGVNVTGSDRNDFTVVTGGVSGSPIVVAPNATHRIVVRFAPTATGERLASLDITSNASANASSVELIGIGRPAVSVETDVTSETGAIGLRLTGANPVTTQSGIELSVRGGEAVTVTVVDASGRTVGTLFDGMASERSLLALDASMLNNGMYTVVASNGVERAILTVVVAR
jgi:hypothetical protein